MQPQYIYIYNMLGLYEVWRCDFWMLFFNSPSPKRTSLWSNSIHIRKFWKGKLTKKIREEHKKRNPGFATVIKYTDKQGKKRFHGSKRLRSTQLLDSMIYSMQACHVMNLILQYHACMHAACIYQMTDPFPPRNYTREFAAHMCKLMPDMLVEKLPPPQLSRADAATKLEKLWAEEEGFGSDCWDDADLRSVARYLLGAKGLKIPKRFEWFVPHNL